MIVKLIYILLVDVLLQLIKSNILESNSNNQLVTSGLRNGPIRRPQCWLA